MKTISKTNDWFGEIGWLADNFKKFTVDELRILVMGANKKPMPEPASNLGNVLRSAQKEGLIEPLPEYTKSKWRGSSRVPRQYWQRPKRKEEVCQP